MSLGSDQNFGRRGEVEEIVEKSTEQRRRSNTSTEKEKNEEKNK